MKYFAKYLPVPDKPKESDTVVTITGFKKKFTDSVELEEPTTIKLFLCISERGSYKVIGEISEAAIWVKEGDRLEVEDLEFWFKNNLTAWFQVKEEYELKYASQQRTEDCEILVKVKCSRCNTFH